MSNDNPYSAPSATLGGSPALLDGDLSAAVNDFIITRRFIRALAGLSLLLLVLMLAGYLMSAMMVTMTREPSQLFGIGVIALTYGVLAVALFRLSSPLYALAEARTWANVTRLFQRMTQTWMLAIITFVLTLIGGIGARFVGPAAVLGAGVTPETSDTVGAARQLRTVLRSFVLLAVVAAVINIILTAVTPMPAQLAMGPAFLWGTLLGGLIAQALILFFLWRHVPALDAFIAQPGADTLAQVAHAHRMLWRLVLIGVWILVGVAVAGIIAALTIPMAMKYGR